MSKKTPDRVLGVVRKLPPVYQWDMIGRRKMKYKSALPRFVAELEAKMERGYKEYGDGTWGREPGSLIREIREELIDVCGWSVILYNRLVEIERRLDMRGTDLPTTAAESLDNCDTET